jgi:hypothetical protein
MLSILATSPVFERDVMTVVDISIQAAATSLVRLPELAAPSSLRQTRYDIRGAMRRPGGEDHFGCLALLRLATESEVLAQVFVRTNASVVIELCKLNEQLKQWKTKEVVVLFMGKVCFRNLDEYFSE